LNVKNEYFKTCDQCRIINKNHQIRLRRIPEHQQKIKKYKQRPEYKAHRLQVIKGNFNSIVSRKINNCKYSDHETNHNYFDDDYVTIEWVINELAKNETKCFQCKKQLKLTNFEPYDKDQFSVDRIFNNMAHEPDNCLISCWGCNNERKNNDIF